MKKAFTMIELIFVIVLIGILSSIAVPKMLGTKYIADSVALRSKLASINLEIAFLNGEVGRLNAKAISKLNAGVNASSKTSNFLCADVNANGKITALKACAASKDYKSFFTALTGLSNSDKTGFISKGNEVYAYKLGGEELEFAYNENSSGKLLCSAATMSGKFAKLCEKLGVAK